MCICAYVQAHTNVYTSVRACALHRHTCACLCMHMCVCVCTYNSNHCENLNFEKKKKKCNEKTEESFYDLCMTMEAFGRATPDTSPVTGQTRVNLDPQRSVSRSRQVSSDRCFTFNNSEEQLCRNVAKLFFPTIYTFSMCPIRRGRDGLKKREREILIS